MRGILRNEFNLLELDWDEVKDGKVENFDKDDVFTFEFGEEVEILKVIKDKSYIDGKAFVILNKNNDSMTVSSIQVELIYE
jgi:hypothetical protein